MGWQLTLDFAIILEMFKKYYHKYLFCRYPFRLDSLSLRYKGHAQL